ncbi:MAG: polysaccharide biosynthesis/export family protein, partial [Candidatus Acidiferrales bacterium]
VSDWFVRRSLLLVAVLFILGVQTAHGQEKVETQQQANEKIQQLASAARFRPVNTPIGTGDVLHIDVFDVPELSRDVRVSATGDISFPLVPGSIPAAGLSTFQLETNIERLLVDNGLVTHPHVSVMVREQNSQPVSVIGAVNHPMVYQVIRPTTLLEILADAGGIADEAGSVILITRSVSPAAAAPSSPPAPSDATPAAEQSAAETSTITIRIQDLLDSGDPAYNIQIFGGDVVSVPRAGIVYVAGAGVSQPGGYVMQGHGEQVTVLKAVALAHGLTGFAKPDSAVIFRTNTVTGQRDMIPVRIKDVEKHKAEDVAMKSNDILYIPDSLGLKVLAKGAEAAVTVSSGLVIYRAGSGN